MSAPMLEVLERLAQWSSIRFDPSAARHALEVVSEHSGDANSLDRLARVGREIGLRVRPLKATPREVIKLTLKGRSVVGFEPESGRWLLLHGGRLGKASLVGPPSEGGTRLVGASKLARLIGAEGQDQLVVWAIIQPLAPADGMRRLDEGLSNLHGSDHDACHSRNPHDHHQDVTYHEPLGRLAGFLRPDWGDIRVVVVFAAAVGVLTLATPLAVESLVMTVGFRMLLQQVVILSLLLFAFLSLGAAMFIVQKVVVEYLQRRFFVRMVADLSYRLPRVEIGALDRGIGQELANRFFDIMTVQKAFATLLVDGVSLVLTALLGLTVMAFYHPYLLGFDIVLVGAIVLFVLLLGRRGVTTAVHESIAKYRTAAWLEELARGPATFKFCGGPTLALERADDLAKEWLIARREHFRVVYRQVLFTAYLQVVASSALLGLGGWLVIQGQLTLGQLVASELIVATIVGSFAKIGKYAENYYDLLAAINKLGFLVDLPIEPRGDESHVGPARAARLTLLRVGYAYEGSPLAAIHNLTVEITPGERVALYGPSGSGKSTLIEILMKGRMPTSGQVELDGLDYRDFRTDSLRSQIGLARPGGIFHGTILDNVRVGRESIPLSEVRYILESVGLWDEVSSLPDGLDMWLTPGGAPLSEGQDRRLLLARAMVGGPRLLLIDDLLDGLDEHIRGRILDVVMDRAAPWTVVVATRDPEVLARCDRTIALPAQVGHTDDGQPPSPVSVTVTSAH